MLARIGSFLLFLLLLALCVAPISGCCSTCPCREGDQPTLVGGTESDQLLRGFAVFGDRQNIPTATARLHLYGTDTYPRPPGTVMSLLGVEIYGKAGTVPVGDLGGTDTLLAEVNPCPGSRTWDAPSRIFDKSKLNLPVAGLSTYTVLARFRYASVQAGVVTTPTVDRSAVFSAITTSRKNDVPIPASVAGDKITKLVANGTFHPQQTQALFDVDELLYDGTAGRIEVFTGPPGTYELFDASHRIYFELSPGTYPWHAEGLIGPYNGTSATWRFGVRVTVAGNPSTKEGIFQNILPGEIIFLP